MNFGQNLYNWFLSNAQSLVLLAIVVIGLYLGFKREFSKLIGFLIIAIIAVGLVFNAAGVNYGSMCASGVHVDCNAVVAGGTLVPACTKVESCTVFSKDKSLSLNALNREL